MERRYERIIGLPHHQSAVRPHMPRTDRAAQFAPFAALTGYDEAVREAARLTENRIELAEDEIILLDERLRMAFQDKLPVSMTCFQPDRKKNGGAYTEVKGQIVSVDSIRRVIVMADLTVVHISEIVAIVIENDQ